MLFEGAKIYKVFSNKDVRHYACIVYPDHRTTMSWARYTKCLVENRILEPWEQVDHIDNNPLNDDPSNLQILTIAENNKKSAKGRSTIQLTCFQCGQRYTKEVRQLKVTSKYCSRSCRYAALRRKLKC